MFVADTETTKNNDGSMRVWLWDICTIGEPYTHVSGTDINDMMQYMFAHPDLYYFHNIKYDGSYILYWLNDNKYTFVNKSVGEPGTYSALITDRNVWFAITITNFDGVTIELHDSYKKLVMSVEKVAEAYKLPMSKGEIDYNAYRPVGYTPTEEELSYVMRDTEIVARALHAQYEQGLDKMTAPACALDAYKHMVDFEKLFATKWWNTHRSAERFCRMAYAGGISWVNPDLQERECKHGLVYDYNSMYPSVMLMYPYPVGCPCRWYDTPPKNKYNLYVARCRVDILLKPGCPACIRDPLHKNWITAFDGELYLTNIDIELLQQNYTGECELLDGYAFKSESGIFDCYINHWAEIKRTSKGAMRALAKLMLNSFYGKFGMNPVKGRKCPVWDDKNILHYKLLPPDDGKCISIAVAIFTTAYARRELIRGYHSCKGYVAYMDTDSLHIVSEYDGCPTKKAASFGGKTHETDFGAWKCEGRFVRAKYLRQKTYIEEKPSGALNIAACGCPASSKNYITYNNFRMGASYKGKLLTKMRVGGTELVNGRFTVKEPIKPF